MTMNGTPSGRRARSITRHTWGPRRFAATRASRTNRSTLSAVATLRSMNFRHTGARSSRCVATATTPIPPGSSTRSTWYFPASSSPGLTGMSGSTRGRYQTRLISL